MDKWTKVFRPPLPQAPDSSSKEDSAPFPLETCLGLIQYYYRGATEAILERLEEAQNPHKDHE